MQRWTAVLFALLTAAFVAIAVTRGGRASGPASTAARDGGAADAAPGADAAVGAATPSLATADAGEPRDAGAPSDDVEARGGEARSDAGATLLSGEVPPALPRETPKTVTFGVVLVQYDGAQGAAPGTRSRDAALVLAKEIAELAKTDFKAAVAKGDKGSAENLGKMERGMLEPAPDYVLFSLPKDGVSDPVDTPRGFWVVRRID